MVLAKNVLARIVLNLVSDLQWLDSQGKNGQYVFWIWILVKQNGEICYGLFIVFSMWIFIVKCKSIPGSWHISIYLEI
jgi:hypothetical protein